MIFKMKYIVTENDEGSAGFVYPDLACYGISESLNLKSRPVQDTVLLRKTIGTMT